mmetsp:Transcript_50227/g.144482  ORF Transcript_50227/g.144482 Transcript_50227/m.144482 type:complete len:405 (+) Transcript_50227:1046-2260(+)
MRLHPGVGLGLRLRAAAHHAGRRGCRLDGRLAGGLHVHRFCHGGRPQQHGHERRLRPRGALCQAADGHGGQDVVLGLGHALLHLGRGVVDDHFRDILPVRHHLRGLRLVLHREHDGAEPRGEGPARHPHEGRQRQGQALGQHPRSRRRQGRGLSVGLAHKDGWCPGARGAHRGEGPGWPRLPQGRQRNLGEVLARHLRDDRGHLRRPLPPLGHHRPHRVGDSGDGPGSRGLGDVQDLHGRRRQAGVPRRWRHGCGGHVKGRFGHLWPRIAIHLSGRVLRPLQQDRALGCGAARERLLDGLQRLLRVHLGRRGHRGPAARRHWQLRGHRRDHHHWDLHLGRGLLAHEGQHVQRPRGLDVRAGAGHDDPRRSGHGLHNRLRLHGSLQHRGGHIAVHLRLRSQAPPR